MRQQQAAIYTRCGSNRQAAILAEAAAGSYLYEMRQQADICLYEMRQQAGSYLYEMRQQADIYLYEMRQQQAAIYTR